MGLSGVGGLVAALLLATGCAVMDFQKLAPGRSTEADVRRALGEPAMVLPAADGSRQLAFPTGPFGTQTWMAYVSAEGRLLRLEQALTDDNLQRVSRGISQDEVLRLIGPPWRRVDFANKRQVAWDYRFQDTWGYLVDYAVMVDERGIVAETVRVRIDKEQGDSR